MTPRLAGKPHRSNAINLVHGCKNAWMDGDAIRKGLRHSISEDNFRAVPLKQEGRVIGGTPWTEYARIDLIFISGFKVDRPTIGQIFSGGEDRFAVLRVERDRLRCLGGKHVYGFIWVDALRNRG